MAVFLLISTLPDGECHVIPAQLARSCAKGYTYLGGTQVCYAILQTPRNFTEDVCAPELLPAYFNTAYLKLTMQMLKDELPREVWLNVDQAKLLDKEWDVYVNLKKQWSKDFSDVLSKWDFVNYENCFKLDTTLLVITLEKCENKYSVLCLTRPIHVALEFNPTVKLTFDPTRSKLDIVVDATNGDVFCYDRSARRILALSEVERTPTKMLYEFNLAAQPFPREYQCKYFDNVNAMYVKSDTIIAHGNNVNPIFVVKVLIDLESDVFFNVAQRIYSPLDELKIRKYLKWNTIIRNMRILKALNYYPANGRILMFLQIEADPSKVNVPSGDKIATIALLRSKLYELFQSPANYYLNRIQYVSLNSTEYCRNATRSETIRVERYCWKKNRIVQVIIECVGDSVFGLMEQRKYEGTSDYCDTNLQIQNTMVVGVHMTLLLLAGVNLMTGLTSVWWRSKLGNRILLQYSMALACCAALSLMDFDKSVILMLTVRLMANYFQSVAFMWALFITFRQHVIHVQMSVVKSSWRKFRKIFFISWAVPLLDVLYPLGVMFISESKHYQKISIENYQLGKLCTILILIANLFVTFITIHRVLRDTKIKKYYSHLLISLAALFILCFIWIFFICYQFHVGEVVVADFSLKLTLLIYLCLLTDKVRTTWMVLYSQLEMILTKTIVKLT